jgi:hypothetical protein
MTLQMLTATFAAELTNTCFIHSSFLYLITCFYLTRNYTQIFPWEGIGIGYKRQVFKYIWELGDLARFKTTCLEQGKGLD